MRKLIGALQIAVDGVVEAPERWSFANFNDELGAAIGAVMGAADALLMGRVLYQEWAGYWPAQASDNAMATMMNSMPKYVVSTTLTQADAWSNSHVINGAIAHAIAQLKQQPGKNMTLSGSPTLVRSLLHHGLIDELHLILHPVVVGSGKRLFPDGSAGQSLTLLDSKTFSTGVVYLTYQPMQRAAL